MTFYEDGYFAKRNLSTDVQDPAGRYFRKVESGFAEVKNDPPNHRVKSIAGIYLFNEPFKLHESRDLEGIPLGHYSDIGEHRI